MKIMTQEEQNLLLTDLSARLTYGVKVSCNDKVYNFNGIQYFNICILTDDNENNAFTTAGIKYIKPYLFPLSSMTEEQEKEFEDLYYRYHESAFFFNERFSYDRYSIKDIGFYPCYLQDWLNKNHFDYRDLIKKGLAIDATNKNIY